MATSVRLDPLTGLPTTKIIGSPVPRTDLYGTAPVLGSSLRPQLPYDEFGDNTSAPKFVGYGGPLPASSTSSSSSSSSSSTSRGSFAPDYAALVAGDPGLQALRAELAAGNISAAEFRKAAIQRAVIAYGAAPDEASLDPSTRGYYTEDVNQLTKDLAAKNTSEGLSTRAQEDRSHQIAVQGLQNVLAARGMLQSGSLGVGLGLEGQQDKTVRARDTAQLLDYLSGQAQAYAEHLHQSKLQEAQAIMDTTQAYMQNYAGSLGGGGSDSDGRGYDVNDFLYGASVPPGYSVDDLYSAASAGAPQGAQVMHVMNQGMVQNGQISVKYKMPDGTTNTIWVPLGTPATQQTQTPTPQPTVTATPTPVAPPAPAPVPAPITSVPTGTIRVGGGY